MRQPGTEFNYDPTKIIIGQELPFPVLPIQLQQDHSKWQKNTANERSHKFCAQLCVNFISGSKLSGDEKSCMNTCFTKYNNAFQSFQQEKKLFNDNLEELKLRGEDLYVARDI